MLPDKGQQFLRKRFSQCLIIFPAKLLKFPLFLTAMPESFVPVSWYTLPRVKKGGLGWALEGWHPGEQAEMKEEKEPGNEAPRVE